MPSIIVVKATFDEEGGVWFTESSDLPGLHIEGASVDELRAKLPGAILDLLEECDDDDHDCVDVPVELIAHASSRVRIRADA
jgi:predicted RNase H-like HicB family nuclease